MNTKVALLRKIKSETQRGFSLIELLIVVAVILIIAAIAIPNFIRSKMRANESAAVSNLRNINTANTVYLTTYGIGFSTSLGKLGGNTAIVDSNNAGLLDSVLSGTGMTSTKSGYLYTYAVTATAPNGEPVAYSVTADPSNYGVTGERHFYTDQTAIIRFNTSVAATSTDTPI
jgi:type IV pilus assembly protein PilA